ncbi:hypothetical protein [Mycolicibacterium brisbanense]|uniref:DUF5666 domain-containing protein n=1 Tax=Mycolicibacterium brisbanense TaxID=146020 RepID=A0A100VUS3_9MYCO|nr:hypothetical protein [Mycolicibacterium brisbanense]MCV7161397.1 hypothetical protein [Mycolicibacterium brisbanense]GAS86249.1 uncharacterized protein RMCB_0345 [Mycolicibacterium brisbanense]
MSVRRTVAAIGVAAAIAGLGGAAVYAATDSPGMGEAGPAGHHGDGPPPWAQPGRDNRDNADAATVHSESVRRDGHGGYTTELTQVGMITALTADSVTVVSTDGFSQTYALPATLKPTWAVNDRVSVRATRSGPTATVTSIGQAASAGQ